ncbi:MAG: DUF4369 domain-containing protein [Bacteroidaceae bacterium]|nr:DUF4369 domain-containing protein [Bacteroidaceae bacterium]
MKSRFYAILTLFVLFLSVSCGRHKGEFVLHGTVQNDIDSILVVGLDSRFDRTDTIVCNNGIFKWSFRPDTATTLILFLPDGRHHPVFAEKDLEATITIPADTGLFYVKGGYSNDSYQSFYLESQNDTSLQQTIERIDSLITRDPFSENIPYVIFEHLVQKHHIDEKSAISLISRVSGMMQDSPYITALKSEFNGEVASNTYLSSWSVKDSLGQSFIFSEVGGSSNHLLLCVWATWTGDEGLSARRAMDSLRVKYSDRKLYIADVSIDVNTEKWKSAIEQDTLDWFSYIDNKGWESTVIKNCNIKSLPYFIICAGTKRVLFHTATFSDLDKELDRILPQPEKKQNKKKNKK